MRIGVRHQQRETVRKALLETGLQGIVFRSAVRLEQIDASVDEGNRSSRGKGSCGVRGRIRLVSIVESEQLGSLRSRVGDFQNRVFTESALQSGVPLLHVRCYQSWSNGKQQRGVGINQRTCRKTQRDSCRAGSPSWRIAQPRDGAVVAGGQQIWIG